MAVREYIGARYVPIFGRVGEQSAEWDNSAPYEPLTVVLYQGNSFTSRQYVPAGVDITNSEYWASTGIYNAQVEAYRAEVQTFNNRIEANTQGIATINENGWVTNPRIADGAVTTGKIADGAVSPDKLSESFFKQYLNYYTPEQFGAIGDGVADDTQAFQDMFDTVPDNAVCVLQSYTYKITDTLTLGKNFIRLTSLERSENKPAISFNLSDYNGKKLLNVTGTGCNFSNIMFAAVGDVNTLNGSWMFYFDGSQNSWNIDATIDNCVIYNCWQAVGIKGRNVHMTNCLISTIYATSIVFEKPSESTPMRGFVFDNNRFHIAGMIINTIDLADYQYLETFNLFFTNNMIDFSKRLYLGISDNVVITNNLVAQTTFDADYLILFTTTINGKTIAQVCNNAVNTQGAVNSMNCPGFVSLGATCQGLVNIVSNNFHTWYNASARAVIVHGVSTLNLIVNIVGNIISTNNAGTPIQMASGDDDHTTGLIDGNCITTVNSQYFISATNFTIGNNFTGHL